MNQLKVLSRKVVFDDYVQKRQDASSYAKSQKQFLSVLSMKTLLSGFAMVLFTDLISLLPSTTGAQSLKDRRLSE